MTLELPATPAADIDDATIDALRASLSGAVLRPGDDGYDDARTIFNGMIDRRPGLIARCAATGDVAKAVTFARERGLVVSVRGGKFRPHYEPTGGPGGPLHRMLDGLLAWKHAPRFGQRFRGFWRMLGGARKIV